MHRSQTFLHCFLSVGNVKNSCFLNLGAFLALKASTAPAENVAVAVSSLCLKDLETQKW